MNLRPYQLDALQAIRKEWTTRKSTLLVLPTGTGKTIVFARLIELLVREEQARVLVLAHRGELLEQAADKIHRVTGLNCAIEKHFRYVSFNSERNPDVNSKGEDNGNRARIC